MYIFKGTAKSRWIQLSRGYEIRRIVRRLASAAAVTRLILQRFVGDDGIARDARVISIGCYGSIGILV